MKHTWMKLYTEILDDPKVGAMPDWLFRKFIHFLLAAKETDKAGLLGPVSDLAWRLRSSEDDVLNALRTMSQIGIAAETPDGWLIVNFAKRQAAMSDADRSRMYRSRHERIAKRDAKRDEERHEGDVTDSLSSSTSSSDSEEGGGVGEGEKQAIELFNGCFGKFFGGKELKRWLILCEAAGWERAEDLTEWALKKEIHLTNRAGLLDSLETAAKNWREKPVRAKSKSSASIQPVVVSPERQEELRRQAQEAFGGAK